MIDDLGLAPVLQRLDDRPDVVGGVEDLVRLVGVVRVVHAGGDQVDQLLAVPALQVAQRRGRRVRDQDADVEAPVPGVVARHPVLARLECGVEQHHLEGDVAGGSVDLLAALLVRYGCVGEADAVPTHLLLDEADGLDAELVEAEREILDRQRLQHVDIDLVQLESLLHPGQVRGRRQPREQLRNGLAGDGHFPS